MRKKGVLYLIPALIGDSATDFALPPSTQAVVNDIRFYAVENLRSARRFLSKLKISTPINDLEFAELNKRTPTNEIEEIVAQLTNGNNVGVISEAGCPGVADPGAEIVSLAHEKGIKIVPMVGPCSILLALMASGMNGQNFVFHGYLPKEKHKRIKSIVEVEKQAFDKNQTQIFMEAPYRNMPLLEDVIKHCKESTQLCIATSITSSDEKIVTRSIAHWRRNIPNINKKPTIFLLSS
ncbi:MAG TPA: SAM-dependent methyltransferase [Flavobacteriales bacterium]|nr:SAM-dependent methyltransferase [Flavobacteriales bacterium]